jgi:predicted flap endonuclease-1-like 5' DNA nuclease
MAWWIILLIGIGIGWLIELIIDFFFWRRRKICAESVTAVRDVQTENARLRAELAVLKDQKDSRGEGLRPDIVQLLTRNEDSASLRSDISALQGQLTTLLSNRGGSGEQSSILSSLMQQLTARTQDISALRSDLTAVRSDLHTLSTPPTSGNQTEMTAALAALAAAVAAAGKGNIDIQIGSRPDYSDLLHEHPDSPEQPSPPGKKGHGGENPQQPSSEEPEKPSVPQTETPQEPENLVDMVINISEEEEDPFTAANRYDDFTKIPKIGKSYRKIFHDAGIKTYQELCTLLQRKEVKRQDEGEPVHIKLDIWETVKQHDALRHFFFESAVASQKLRDAWQAVVCALADGNRRQINLKEQDFKAIVESRAQFDNICGLNNTIERELYAAKIYTFYDLENAADKQLIPILTKNSRRKTELAERFGTAGGEEKDVQKWLERIRYQAQLLREGKSEARKIDNLANCHDTSLIRNICGIDTEIEKALEYSGIDSPDALVRSIQADRQSVISVLAPFQERLILAYGEALMQIKVDDKAQRFAKVIDHINAQASLLSQKKWVEFLDYKEDCCGALSLETFKRSSWRRKDLTEEAKQSYEKTFAAYRAQESAYEKWVKWLQDNQFIELAAEASTESRVEGQ